MRLTRRLPYNDLLSMARIPPDPDEACTLMDASIEVYGKRLSKRAIARLYRPKKPNTRTRSPKKTGSGRFGTGRTAPLTPDEIRQIRALIEKGERNGEIAEKFSLSETTVSRIRHRKIFNDIN